MLGIRDMAAWDGIVVEAVFRVRTALHTLGTWAWRKVVSVVAQAPGLRLGEVPPSRCMAAAALDGFMPIVWRRVTGMETHLGM